MTAPGTLMFSGLSLGKETTHGTLVAATRAFYPEGMGLLTIDRKRTRHEGAQRGTASNITYETQMGITVNIPYRTNPTRGVTWNELPFYFCNLVGSVTGTGGSANKTWTYAPSQTTDPASESFTAEVYSDIQEWETGYVMARGFTLGAARDAMTIGSLDLFGQTIAKSTKTTPVHNNDLTIPGYLWTIKFATAQSGLAGASISANFLRSWELAVDTGYRPSEYLDGTAYFGQAVRSANLGGTLTLTVDDTALAVTEMYDKAAAGTVTFVRLKATGVALGSGNYDAQIDLGILWGEPDLFSGDVDGINTHSVTGTIVYDSTYTNSMGMIVVNAIAALTA